MRQAVDDAPWSNAILRAVENEGYRSARQAAEGWFAKRLGIWLAEEHGCAALLLRDGQRYVAD